MDGNVLAGPSGDPVSDDVLLANTFFPVLYPTWNLLGSPPAPRREVQDAPSDAPDSKTPKTGGPAESEREFTPFT